MITGATILGPNGASARWASLPASGGSTVNVQGVPALSSPNSGLSIGNSIVPELDISYYFTPNVAAELILGVTPHNITGTGALANTNIGRAWLLPPTLLAQWHFTDFGPFKPYIGLGVNYTIFFGQSAGYTPTNGLGVTNLTLHNTVGGALQVGFDYMIDKHWGLNFDVQEVPAAPRPTMPRSTTPSPVTGTAAIDPWIIGAGVTYRF
jgi:outer membrane protein